jgi:membrane protein DedA with SNARE-associated domain
MTGTQELIYSLGTLSYLGIFGVSLLANMIIPVPEEVVLLAFGYLAGTGVVNGFILVPIIIGGLLISDSILYYLSKKGDRFITWLYNKFFSKRLDDKKEWLLLHIEKVIFFSRFLIQLRFLGPFLAGQAKVKWRTFLTYELSALVIYVPLLIWIGSYFRNRVKFIISGIGAIRNAVLIFVGILFLVFISKFLKRFLLGKTAPKK